MIDSSVFPSRGQDDGPEGLVDFLVGFTSLLREVGDLAGELADYDSADEDPEESALPPRGAMLDVLLGLVALQQRWDPIVATLGPLVDRASTTEPPEDILR